MLALTRKTDYALIALAHLAKQPGGVVSAREIADIYKLPLPILTNILKTLSQAGIVISERGSMGGYGLAKPAGAITLHELISAIEGPFQFVRCVLSERETGQSSCDLEPSCPIRLPAQRIRKRLKSFLENVTLAELMDDEGTAGEANRVEPTRLPTPAVKELA